MPPGRDRRKALALIGAVAALAPLGGGCGGGATASEVSLAPVQALKASPLPKPAFVKQALAVCAKAREETAPEYRDYLRRNKLGVILGRADVMNHAADLILIDARRFKRELDGIVALGAPRGDERRVRAILEAIAQGVEAAEKRPLSYFYNTYGDNPMHRPWLLAYSYGIGPCALR